MTSTPEQVAFRAAVRAFVGDRLPRGIAEKVKHGAHVDKAELTAWTRTLNQRGWAAPHWPTAYGGTGWTLVQRHLFDVECRLAHAPPLAGFGFNMVGPAIVRYGSDAQRERFLPAIRNADTWWCQGYSEPQAGSDLAALLTRAVRDGDDYIVDGLKIWTSAAEDADWIFVLAKTDTRVAPQRGISFLLVDLTSPGIRIEPLYAFNGKRLWNQVFFDAVRVPAQNRLGDENAGWTVAKRLLGDERLMVSRVAENRRMLSRLVEVVRAEQNSGQLQGDGAAFAARIAALTIRLEALEATSLRLLGEADRGGVIGAQPSMLKLKGSELVQAMDEALFEAIGYWAAPLDTAVGAGNESIGPVYAQYVASARYHHRGYTIAGGSSEVQHNIIAKEVLGL